MATKSQQMQKLMRLYKRETGNSELNMHEVAKFAAGRGWPLPAPLNALDRLAKEFSQAAREETRHDKQTGRPYRANHAYTVRQGSTQLTLWVDIDEAPRKVMIKSLVQRREQMVGDAVQLSFDMEHWNARNPSEEPIDLPMDFTEDVEWRKNAPFEIKIAS